MVTPHGIKFAVHIITKDFGNLVAKVCEYLFSHGPLTLDQLVRHTELTNEQVKNSLLVLIQHNCAQPFVSAPQEGADDEAGKLRVGTQYLVLFDNILHRLRFPKFLEIVSSKFNDECVDILKGLLRDGRLTLKQMVDRASQGKENAVATSVVRESLCKLLTAQVVERCPATEPVVSTVFKEETTTKKLGSKAAKISEAPQTIEQRVLEAAVPGEAIRFSFTADTGCKADGEANSDDTQVTSTGENVAKEEEILWCANFEEFIRHLRHKVLFESVRTKYDDGTATVLSAILEATRTIEKKVKMESSVPLSLDTVITEVMKTEAGRTMTADRIQASLGHDRLGCSQKMIIHDAYSIDLKKIIEHARNEEVESIVLKRYGRDAHRIFRLLSKDNCFHDTDQIAAKTLVDKREVPKLLYKLWKDNYLHVEKVLVPGPKLSAYTLMWKVNKALLWECVLDEMYHVALNLSSRMYVEHEKDKELLSVPKDKLLMKLDDALMLFHDF
ncbi:hypothetical protein RJT34_24095 [Clitoria ternatea]|uniref:DNA-directed RNA polymerase III subunit RPC3 n=1 Tax=Clitoria ternatea TaxID=43366 RepID=A0AAN9IH61_CLITE